MMTDGYAVVFLSYAFLQCWSVVLVFISNVDYCTHWLEKCKVHYFVKIIFFRRKPQAVMDLQPRPKF